MIAGMYRTSGLEVFASQLNAVGHAHPDLVGHILLGQLQSKSRLPSTANCYVEELDSLDRRR
jgi:hypothetical protein